MLKSDVIYKIQCPMCKHCYVGQTERHLTSRYREHVINEGPMKAHADKCKASLSDENISIERQIREKTKLATYEALYQKMLRPEINVKDEFRSRKLKIKWLLDSLYGDRGKVASQES